MSTRVIALVDLLDKTLADIQADSHCGAITTSEFLLWRAQRHNLPALREIADRARLEQAEAAVRAVRQGGEGYPAGG